MAPHSRQLCLQSAGVGTAGGATSFHRARGWVEDNMNRRDRELLDRQMSRIQLPVRRDGVLILAMAGVFIAGLTVGGFMFTFGGNRCLVV